jgi:hypothetical protein
MKDKQKNDNKDFFYKLIDFTSDIIIKFIVVTVILVVGALVFNLLRG